jgi:hypothetical protein
MRCVATVFALLAGVMVLSLSLSAPARAEFFGCHDRRGQVLYTYNGTPSQFHDRYAGSSYSQPRIRYSRAGSSDYDSRYWNERSRY